MQLHLDHIKVISRSFGGHVPLAFELVYKFLLQIEILTPIRVGVKGGELYRITPSSVNASLPSGLFLDVIHLC